MQHRKRQITLKQRMGLCLAAFFAAFAMQLTLNGFQSRAVQAVQDAQMGCFNAISRFQGGVESSISVLENYRWENSEPEEIIDRLQSASSTCNAWLWRIGTSLNSLESVSDEQRVLYSAVDTVYQTYTGLLDELENDLLSGNDAAASQLYYAKVVPCGDYLSQYTLQLLETAIQDSQTTYTTISALNERITMLQTVVVALCVALRFFPTMGKEFSSVAEAMKVRGMALSPATVLRHPALTAENLMVPVMSRLAIVADELSNAAIVRGIDSAAARTSYYELRFGPADALFAALFGAVVACVALIKLGVIA